MTESEYSVERTCASDELLRRLMCLISYNLPALQRDLNDLWTEYQRVLTEINNEYK